VKDVVKTLRTDLSELRLVVPLASALASALVAEVMRSLERVDTPLIPWVGR
jgi:hypothetical protein